MRLSRWMAATVVVAGVVGCGEAVGPPAIGRDLEFDAPAARVAARANAFRSWYEPVTAADSAELVGLGGGTSFAEAEQIPLISRYFVAGSWEDATYTVEYGMFGGGTGYTMSPHVRIVDEKGVTVLNQPGTGRSEDAPLYWYMRPTAQERYTMHSSCGGFGETNVGFEARLALAGFGPTIMRMQVSDDATTYQPMCPPPPTQGGYGPPPSGYVITICQYESWVDAWGTVIATFELGCTSYGGQILAE